MSKVITKTVYTIDELEGSAKDRAMQWLSEANTDYDWWDCIYEDAQNIGALMGLEIGTYRKNEIDLWFSGFSSQGDGACWGGSIDWRLFNGAETRVKEYAPEDKKLHAIAHDCQLAYNTAINAVKSLANAGEEDNAAEYLKDGLYSFSVKSDDRYKVQRVDGDSIDLDDETIFAENADFDTSELIDAVQEIADDFANWVYRLLESEYDFRTGEAELIDFANVNEYTFDEYGNREGRHPSRQMYDKCPIPSPLGRGIVRVQHQRGKPCLS